MSTTITLVSKGSVSFPISRNAAMLSLMLRGLLEEFQDEASMEIPIDSIEAPVLGLLIQFMERCVATAAEPIPAIERPLRCTFEEAVPKWVSEFVNALSLADTMALLAAANFLSLESFLEVGCAKIAIVLRECGSPEKIRETFDIPNDFTIEEEKKLREEYAWAFQA